MSLSSLATYISVLKNYEHIGFLPGDQTIKVLDQFSNQRYMSAYKIYSKFKSEGSKMDYKNIHKRVKRLESLKFIEPVKVAEVKEEDSKRRAIYYRISEAGMFQVFYHHVSIQYLHSILVNNGNYLIFDAFLYPYFRKETLIMTEPDLIISLDIINYLNDCCTMALNVIEPHEEHVTSLSVFEFYIRALINELVMKILLMFRFYGEAIAAKDEVIDHLPILAKDDKFMKVADDLHKDFEKGFNKAMRIGKRY